LNRPTRRHIRQLVGNFWSAVLVQKNLKLTPDRMWYDATKPYLSPSSDYNIGRVHILHSRLFIAVWQISSHVAYIMSSLHVILGLRSSFPLFSFSVLLPKLTFFLHFIALYLIFRSQKHNDNRYGSVPSFVTVAWSAIE